MHKNPYFYIVFSILDKNKESYMENIKVLTNLKESKQYFKEIGIKAKGSQVVLGKLSVIQTGILDK